MHSFHRIIHSIMSTLRYAKTDEFYPAAPLPEQAGARRAAG